MIPDPSRSGTPGGAWNNPRFEPERTRGRPPGEAPLATPLSPSERGVAVFGASDAEPGSEAYERARAVGAGLARRGVAVVTGGYGGVREAASRGAREAGGEAVGVTCRAFAWRRPSPWVSLEIEEDDLFTRTARMFAISRGFVVVGGGAGTLAELAMLWAHARMEALPGPIVLLDAVWERLSDDLALAGRLERRCLAATRRAAGADEAVALALAPLAGRGALEEG
jgi:hypothetical protein